MSDKKHDQEHEAEKSEGPQQAGPNGGPGELPEGDKASHEESEIHEIQRETEEERHSKHKLSKKEAEIRALREERDELKDKYLRALAEMENLRKRSEREKSEFYQFSLAEVLQDFLEVSDSFEQALRTEDQADGKVFQEGMRMIHRQLLDTLARRGVTPIRDVVGSRFDPTLHQALSTEEADDVQEAVVSEELRRGYRLHDRLLRPALVKVKVPRRTSSD
jgi:molecular chaperone GrpE